MNKKLIAALSLIPCLSFALPVRPGENFRMQIPGEFIVKTNGQKNNLNIKKVLGKNLFLVKSDNSKSLNNFSNVYPNYAYYGEYKEGDLTPNDLEFSKQHHHTMIGTTSAWNTTMGSEEIIVAVTDNEFQIDHLDLQTTWWTNKNEIPDNGIDDDGNGYIDDVFGWDFIEGDNDVDVTDEGTHGTHIAGIIAATRNNQLGGSGIAPGVKVMPLKWYDYDLRWTSAIILETYTYAVDHGAKIISTSYNIDGFHDDEAYLSAVKYAKDHDVLVFNSAGNTSTLNPERQKIEDVVLVCSVQSKDNSSVDKKSRFSNYGTGIDICAPGDPVYSTAQAYGGVQDKYREMKGTSMAAPVAAAAAALIWSANPNFSGAEVLQRLYDSADDIEHTNPSYKGLLGHGRVNVFNAVK